MPPPKASALFRALRAATLAKALIRRTTTTSPPLPVNLVQTSPWCFARVEEGRAVAAPAPVPARVLAAKDKVKDKEDQALRQQALRQQAHHPHPPRLLRHPQRRPPPPRPTTSQQLRIKLRSISHRTTVTIQTITLSGYTRPSPRRCKPSRQLLGTRRDTSTSTNMPTTRSTSADMVTHNLYRVLMCPCLPRLCPVAYLFSILIPLHLSCSASPWRKRFPTGWVVGLPSLL